MESKVTTILPYPVRDIWEIVTNNHDVAWRSDITKVEVNGKQFTEFTKQNFATEFTITKMNKEQQYEFDLVNKNMRGHWIGTFVKIDEMHTSLELIEVITVKNKIMKLLAPIYLKRQQKRYIKDLCHVLKNNI